MRDSILTKLARLTVRSCLEPTLQPAVPSPMQQRCASIATRALSVPFGVRFSHASTAVPIERVTSNSNAADSAVPAWRSDHQWFAPPQYSRGKAHGHHPIRSRLSAGARTPVSGSAGRCARRSPRFAQARLGAPEQIAVARNSDSSREYRRCPMQNLPS